MAGVTLSTGAFSGTNTDQIVTQLMALEKQPLTTLSTQKASYQAKISSYGTLSGALSGLKSAAAQLADAEFLSMSSTVSDNSVFTATAGSTASTGDYSIKVSKLASSQSIYSPSYTAESSEVADLSAFSTQKLSIQVGSNAAVEVSITSANNSLTGLRDSINSAGAGVAASVVYDGSGYRLILSANSTGASNRIVVKADENGDGTYTGAGGDIDNTGLSKLAFNATYDSNGLVTGGTANMTQSQAAIDAALTVNGLSVTRSSNQISDLITGVSINLLKTETTNDVKLSVTKDNSSGAAKVSAFVSAYNSVMSLAKSLTSITDGKKVLLTGDVTARTIMTGLRSAIASKFEGQSAASLGLSHDKNGSLTLNSSTLSAAMESDVSGVAATLNAMASSLDKSVSEYISTMIPARKTGMKNSISRIDDKMESINRNLTLKESSYRKKFRAMEEILGKLQQSSDFLTQQANKSSGK